MAMEQIRIRRFDKRLDIRLTGERVELPPELRQKVDAYWKQAVRAKPNMFNGEVFHVASVTETAGPMAGCTSNGVTIESCTSGVP